MSDGASPVIWCARSSYYNCLGVPLLHSTYPLHHTSPSSIGPCVDSTSFFTSFLPVQVSNFTCSYPLTRPSLRELFHPLIDPSCRLWAFYFWFFFFLPQPQTIFFSPSLVGFFSFLHPRRSLQNHPVCNFRGSNSFLIWHRQDFNLYGHTLGTSHRLAAELLPTISRACLNPRVGARVFLY